LKEEERIEELEKQKVESEAVKVQALAF